MKRMQYIVLLNILVSTISMQAGIGGAGESKRPRLQFPQARVHRHLQDQRAKTLAEAMKSMRLKEEERQSEERERIALYAFMKLESEIDEQVEKQVATILATIDPSTLEKINLEGLD